jgi:hypothetical protein
MHNFTLSALSQPAPLYVDPIDEFVREQLASDHFSDHEALVRYALANLKDRQSEIDEIAEELPPGMGSTQRGEPGLTVDLNTSNFQKSRRLNPQLPLLQISTLLCCSPG